MYRTSNTPPVLSPASRCALALLAICMLISAAPCADLDSDGACGLCDLDDLAPGTMLPCLGGGTLLIERPDCAPITPPASLASEFPHPPTF